MNILCKILICGILAATFTACNNATVEGSWVEPVPGMPNMTQGFTLANDGSATSINMATLQYEKWEQKEDSLILLGKSIGNHQTISFSDTLIIEKQTPNKLTIKQNNATRIYNRAK